MIDIMNVVLHFVGLQVFNRGQAIVSLGGRSLSLSVVFWSALDNYGTQSFVASSPFHVAFIVNIQWEFQIRLLRICHFQSLSCSALAGVEEESMQDSREESFVLQRPVWWCCGCGLAGCCLSSTARVCRRMDIHIACQKVMGSSNPQHYFLGLIMYKILPFDK